MLLRSINTAAYFNRVYIEGKYECLHFVCDVWRDLTGIDLADRLRKALSGPPEARTIQRAGEVAFSILRAPVAPCLVLMLAPNRRAHIGVWLNGRVLHLHRGGVEHSDLEVASRTFKKVRFIVCKNN